MKTTTTNWNTRGVPKDSGGKLILVRCNGQNCLTFGSYYADDEASAPCWHNESGFVMSPEEKVIGWAETTPSKPKKRLKGPNPPEFIYADYADRKWAFYGSLKAQRSNRPDLKPIKLKVVEA